MTREEYTKVCNRLTYRIRKLDALSPKAYAYRNLLIVLAGRAFIEKGSFDTAIHLIKQIDNTVFPI